MRDIAIFNIIDGRLYYVGVGTENYEDAVMYAMRKLSKKFKGRPYHFIDPNRSGQRASHGLF